MKKWFYPVVLATAVMSVATPAAAQAPSRTSTGPLVNQWYVGGTSGVAAVQKAGALASVEAGIRVLPKLDVSLELGWFQNATTRRRTGLAETLAGALGDTAVSSVKVPTTYGMVNARYVLESQRAYRPYAVFGIGGARIAPKSTFTLGGTDISGQLAQYGVTLGLDLSGHRSHPAFTGGVGVLVPYGKWYGDAGVRVTNIRTEGQATNVVRLNIGVGARF